MRILTQEAMQRLFEVIDEIPLDREAVQVPLAMEGLGSVAKLVNGKVEVVLPDTDDLSDFLAQLPERLAALDSSA
ncbi:MAG TPA: hypothetical protein VN851_26365 [Thermoanaerobaculia bacterium]|nr:hypothetical protein [Thermoanaerobaculia bacterium]